VFVFLTEADRTDFETEIDSAVLEGGEVDEGQTFRSRSGEGELCLRPPSVVLRVLASVTVDGVALAVGSVVRDFDVVVAQKAESLLV